jgi:hypothetical protein
MITATATTLSQLRAVENIAAVWRTPLSAILKDPRPYPTQRTRELSPQTPTR